LKEISSLGVLYDKVFSGEKNNLREERMVTKINKMSQYYSKG
jgi:hypothetical protein